MVRDWGVKLLSDVLSSSSSSSSILPISAAEDLTAWQCLYDVIMVRERNCSSHRLQTHNAATCITHISRWGLCHHG
jgi:hypothetical protein